MKLTIAERLKLGQVLPKEGDFTTLKILRELRESLSFTEDELKQFKFEQEEIEVDGKKMTQTTWDTEEAKKEVEITMGDKALEIVRETMSGLDKAKKLDEGLFTCYEKFCQEKEEKKE